MIKFTIIIEMHKFSNMVYTTVQLRDITKKMSLEDVVRMAKRMEKTKS